MIENFTNINSRYNNKNKAEGSFCGKWGGSTNVGACCLLKRLMIHSTSSFNQYPSTRLYIDLSMWIKFGKGVGTGYWKRRHDCIDSYIMHLSATSFWPFKRLIHSSFAFLTITFLLTELYNNGKVWIPLVL